MDSEYLKTSVGPYLAKGLSAVAVQQPEDPVEYLAKWLLNHARNMEREQEEAEKRRMLAREEEELEAVRAQKNVEEGARRAKEQAVELETKRMEKALQKLPELTESYQTIVDAIMARLGPAATYIGYIYHPPASVKKFTMISDAIALTWLPPPAPGDVQEPEDPDEALTEEGFAPGTVITYNVYRAKVPWLEGWWSPELDGASIIEDCEHRTCVDTGLEMNQTYWYAVAPVINGVEHGEVSCEIEDQEVTFDEEDEDAPTPAAAEGEEPEPAGPPADAEPYLDAEGNPIEAPKNMIRYVCTSDSNDWMKHRSLTRTTGEKGGVTFQQCVDVKYEGLCPPKPPTPREEGEEEDPENPPEEEEEKEPEPDIPYDRFGGTCWIHNAIREPKLKFFGVPQLGSYFSVPFHNGQDIIIPGEGGTGAPVCGIIGVDTLGQLRDFSEEDIDYVKNLSNWLSSAHHRILKEKMVIRAGRREQERLERERIDAENAQMLADYEKQQEEKRAALEAEEAALADNEELAPEDVEKGKVQIRQKRLEAVHEEINALDRKKIDELKSYNVPPKTVGRVLRAVFYLLGEKKKEVADWPKCRQKIGMDLLTRIIEYDPTAVQKKRKFAMIQTELDGLDDEGVRKASYAAFVLFDWINASIELRSESVKFRQWQKEERARKKEEARIAREEAGEDEDGEGAAPPPPEEEEEEEEEVPEDME